MSMHARAKRDISPSTVPGPICLLNERQLSQRQTRCIQSLCDSPSRRLVVSAQGGFGPWQIRRRSQAGPRRSVAEGFDFAKMA